MFNFIINYIVIYFVIQIKLLQSMNGGYLIKFEKKGGEIEDYYKNLKNIIEIIKQII